MKSTTKTNLLELPPNAVKDIRKIHNLDEPSRLNEAVDLLEEWVTKQDHFLKKDFSRLYLEKTLISAKGSVEKTKKLLDRLCTMRTLLPHFFTKTNVKEELKEVLDIGYLIPLPTITDDFYRVLFIKINDKDFTERNYLEYYQYNMIIAEYIKAHDYVNGFIIVYDLATNVLDLVTKVNPVLLQQYLSILIEGYGTRMKGIYVLTQSKTVDLFIKLIRQFLSKKIAERTAAVKTLDELYEKVPRHILPEEYGGSARSTRKILDDWIEKLSTEEHVNYVKMMNKARTDESLRTRNHFNEEYMGTPGSFRHLTVD